MRFKFEEAEYNMTTNWSDMTMRQFIDLNKIQEKQKVLAMSDDILTQQLVEVLAKVDIGAFDEMSYGQLCELAPPLVELMNSLNSLNAVNITPPLYFEVGGINYSYKQNAFDYNVGEVSDIKTMITNKKNDWDYLADIASVMIRPATKEVTEGGTEYWKLIKRNPLDFESNKRVILSMKLVDVIPVINFFLNGLLK
jgi:hypothetical protein